MERKRIKREDRIDGTIYWYANEGETVVYKQHGDSKYLNRDRTQFRVSHFAFSDILYEATQEEIEHLQLCIGANQFVPFTKIVHEPAIVNQFPIY